MAELESYRVLVTGSRDWVSPLEVYERLADVRAVAHESGRYGRFIVVHGACPKGADKHAARWCLFPDAFADMPVIEEAHPAGWVAPCRPACNHGPRRRDSRGREYCPAAGDYRNEYMVSRGAHACRAFIMPCTNRNCRKRRPHGSHGATQCADLAETAGIPVRRIY